MSLTPVTVSKILARCVYVGMGVLVGCILAKEANGATLGVHTVTAHELGGYRSVTPGLYMRTETGLGAGVLRNSLGRLGVHVTQTWQTAPGPLRLAVSVGGITGYAERVTPLVSPSVLIADRARVMYLPRKPGEPHSSQALHLAFEF